MKKLILFISLIFVLNGCFKTPVKTGAISEENRMHMSALAIGMTQDSVLDVMGYPYKTEEEISQNKIYEIWYYITEPTLLGQSRLITRNFTPLVFESGHLKGWGRNYYKHTFDIDDERLKRQEEKRQQYTDDKEEWPKNEHTIITPLNAPKATPAATSPSTEINATKEKPSDPKPAGQKKPACCTKKAEKTNACERCKAPISTKKDTSLAPTLIKETKESSKPAKVPSTTITNSTKTTTPNTQKESDSKKEEMTAPCKDKKDTDEGYNFWE